MKDIEDEIPFDLPNNWCWIRLQEIADIARGGSPRPIEDYLTNDESGINWIKIGDTKPGSKYIVSAKEKIKAEGKNHSRYVQAGDFLLTNSMSFGRPYILKIDGCIHDGWLVFANIKNCLLQDYLYHALSSKYIYDSFSLVAAGSTVKNLKSDTVKQVLFPLPPIDEQKRILEEIERIIEIIEKLDDDKMELSQAIIQTKSKILDLAIHGKLVPQDSFDEPASVLLEKLRAKKEAKIKAGELKRDKNDSYIYKNTTDNCYYEKFTGKEPVCIYEEIPFDIPDNWQWCRLNELGETNIGLIYHPTDLVNTGVPVLRSNNIQNDCLCLDDLARVQTKILDNQYVADGDILICARNGSQALVGKCTLIKNIPEKMAFGAFMAVFRSKYNDYILRYLQSFYFKDYMRESNSTQIYQLTQAMLKNALIPLPPISEQKRIISKIEEMFKRLDQIQNNLI